jgi:hypothetical protein
MDKTTKHMQGLNRYEFLQQSKSLNMNMDVTDRLII